MLGAVINLYKPQRNLSAESRAAVEAAIALVSHVFDTNLHDYSKIAEAPSHSITKEQTIFSLCVPPTLGTGGLEKVATTRMGK